MQQFFSHSDLLPLKLNRAILLGLKFLNLKSEVFIPSFQRDTCYLLKYSDVKTIKFHLLDTYKKINL